MRVQSENNERKKEGWGMLSNLQHFLNKKGVLELQDGE